MSPVRTETAEGVRSIILNRPREYNTITPELRDALALASTRPTPTRTCT